MAEFVPQMLQSESIAAFAEAMAKAQAEFTNPVQNCEGKVSGVSKSGKPYDYTYRYADLASVLDCVRPVLAKHGIATMQFPRIDGNAMYVETRLIRPGPPEDGRLADLRQALLADIDDWRQRRCGPGRRARRGCAPEV